MQGSLQAVSPAQARAFTQTPALASAYIHRRQARGPDTSRWPPEMRRQFEEAQRTLQGQFPEQMRALAAEERRYGGALDALEPFEPVLDLATGWDMLHFALSGHGGAAELPADFLLLGEPLGDDVGYGPARFHDATAVRAFAAFIAPLDGERLAARLDFAQMAQAMVYPVSGIVGSPQEEVGARDEVRRAFFALKTYIDHAVGLGGGMLLWIE